MVVGCGSLNENDLHKLVYLNAESLVGGTVLGRVGRCGLVETAI